MSTPIIVSQLGQARESARAAAREEGAAARTTRSRPLMTAISLALAAVAIAGAVAAPLVDEDGDLATQIVRAVVVVAFAVAGLIALARRSGEKQPIVVLLFAALGGLVTVSASVLDAHAHGTVVTSSALSLAHFALPVAAALLPIAAMHVLLGIPDGSCKLSRVVIVSGYIAGGAIGLVLWAQRPSLPLWPILIEAVIAVSIGAGASQRRYAHSSGLERQRMQWFGWAAAVAVEMLLVSLALWVLVDWPTRASLVLTAAAPAVRGGGGDVRYPAFCRPGRPDPDLYSLAGRADRRRGRRVPGYRGRTG